jgi:hypothetical protein
MAAKSDRINNLLTKADGLVKNLRVVLDHQIAATQKLDCIVAMDQATFEKTYQVFLTEYTPKRKTLFKYPMMVKALLESFYSFLEQTGKVPVSPKGSPTS